MKAEYIAVAAVFAVLIGLIAYEHMIWNECRATNSWFYCFRVMSK